MAKKVLIIILSSLVGLLSIAAIVVFGIMPVTYDVSEELTKVENSTYIVENQKYTTISKTYKNALDSFKIISFTDLHFDTYKDEGGNITFDLMVKNIKNEKPDLIVFDGDIITSALNLKRTKQLCEALEKLGVYWTLCLGNHEHDNAFSISRKLMIKTMAKYDHCLIDNSTKKTSAGDDVWGVGNHVINILDKDGKISQSLYLLDSGQDMSEDDIEKYKNELYPEGLGSDYHKYDYVKESQITWYKETVADINKINGSNVKSMMFCHIAVPEIEDAWMSLTNEGIEVKDEYHKKSYQYNVNLLAALSGTFLLYGERRELVNTSRHNSGLFNACKENGTQAMWFGHDHINDFVLTYKGVVLGYIKAGGYTQYNTTSKKYIVNSETGEKKTFEDHLIQGYTLINIYQTGLFTFESKENYSLYPDMNQYILTNMKKK